MSTSDQASISALSSNPFFDKYNGRLISALKWEDLDDLYSRIASNAEGWFIYKSDQDPPENKVSGAMLIRFLEENAAQLKHRHDYDYCGIVYADSMENPEFVKIYDPGNLGVSCGFSDNPPLPGWILSRVEPGDIRPSAAAPKGFFNWLGRLTEK